jgi:hypothetical protein
VKLDAERALVAWAPREEREVATFTVRVTDAAGAAEERSGRVECRRAGFHFVEMQGGSDDNPGTEERPWKTIGRASTELKPGETVYVRAGAYDESRGPEGEQMSPGLQVVIGEYGHAGTDRGLYVNGSGQSGEPGAALCMTLSRNTHSATIGRFLGDGDREQILVRSNTHVGDEDVRDHRIVDVGPDGKPREIAVRRLDTPWKDATELGRAKAEYPRAIDWDGDRECEIAAVERHVPDPRATVHEWRTGKRIAETAHRGMMEAGIRVCDVSGDGREELIVWNENEVAVYFNPAPSKREEVPLRRRDRIYARMKSAGNVTYNPP